MFEVEEAAAEQKQSSHDVAHVMYTELQPHWLASCLLTIAGVLFFF